VVEVTYAIYNKLIGEVDKATKNLLVAMELAASENLIMFFINGNEQIYDLQLEIIKNHSFENSEIPRTFLDNLKVNIEKRKKHKKNHITAGLSGRELDALKLIAENMSNQEIADKLFISLNTVKTHAKNIFLKLEVDSRIQAVTKAKELGII